MDSAKRQALEETTRWNPGEVEGRVFERWMEGGWFHPPAEGSPAENFSIAIPPPNVTGALHMGHALNGTIQDALVRINRMRGRNDDVGPRDRSRRDRDAGGGREGAGEGGPDPPGDRPRRLHRAGLGVEGRVRLDDHRAVQAARRVLRLRARALHARRGLRAGRLPRLHRALREGLDLPRQLPRQLGPRAALGDLRSRDRAARGHRHPVRDRLPARRRLGRAGRRHGAPGDDARGRRGGREPG